jgi:hypothetical protein
MYVVSTYMVAMNYGAMECQLEIRCNRSLASPTG